MTAPATIAAVVQRVTPAFVAALDAPAGLTPDSLGVLDPDTLRAALVSSFARFGLPEEQADATADVLLVAITEQPTDPQQALVNTATLLSLLYASSGWLTTAVGEMSVALEAEVAGKLDASQKGAANGVAELDGDGLVPAAQLPGSALYAPLSLVDAKGDLLVGSAPDTLVRLPTSSLHRRALQPDPAAASGLGWAPIDYRYVPVAGDVVSVQATGSSAVSALTALTMQGHYLPLVAGPIDRIGVYHTANAASTWRVLLYPVSATTGLPLGEALLLDAGVIDLSAGAGAFNWKTVAYSLPHDGLYAAFAQGVTYSVAPSVHSLLYSSSPQLGVLGLPVNTASVGRAQVGFTVTAPSTAAPATCPSTAFAWTGQVPRIHVRYA